jgi:hypothetical protein
MTDLISRLRARQMQQAQRSPGDRTTKVVVVDDPLCQQAADEIERLRAALADIAQHQDSEWPLRCRMNVQTARAALKEQT